MSIKAQKRRQKSIDNGTYKKARGKAPQPKSGNHTNGSPTAVNPPAESKNFFNPLEYHDNPQQKSPQLAKNQQPTVEGFDISSFVKETPKIDLGAIAEDAMLAMSKALTPRNQAGNQLPLAYENHVQEAMLPHFGPNGSGYTAPIGYTEDFAGGRTPDNLTYQPGFVVGMKDTNGDLQYHEIFSDPVLNLSPEQRKALELGQQMLQKQADEQTAEEQSSFSSNSGFDTVIDNPLDGCLYFNSTKGRVGLTNFRVIPLEICTVFEKSNSFEPKHEYLIRVICGADYKDIRLTAAELDNVVKIIQVELPACVVLPGVQKAHNYIGNYIRQMLTSIPKKTYIEATGFRKVNGSWVYVHDGAIPPDSNTILSTGKYIPDDRRVTDVQAFRNAMAFLDICGKDELIIPLFLLAHLGPLFQMFHEVGRTPRFVTVLAGRSGSLKTSLSLVLYRLYQDQGQTPTASFRDTETAMEIKLGELNGSVGIFDDLRPPVSDLRSKVNIEKLESIIRAVGDHVAKSRSNTKLDKAKEFIPSGCALVTAEDLSGSQSSLLRCLVLSISKGDIDGAKLRHFQNNSDLITTHMSRFLTWVGLHGDEIVSVIRNDYPNHLFEGKVTELRLVDTAATLMITAQLLAAYAGMCGAMNEEQVHTFMERCYNAICSAIIASEAMTKEANPCTMYLSALFDLIEQGEIRLVDNITFYNSDSCCGFISAGYAWVDPHAAYAKIRQYYSRLNTVFPLTENQLNVHLADAELIEVTYETRNGTQKRLFTKKSSLPSRKRMMVIDIERAMAYLEENGNN